MNNTKRFFWIDNLKGFLILLVILGHCIQHTISDYQSNIVFQFIYSFHMPLFIFVSGYVSYRDCLKWLTIKKRFLQLIIPFMVWTILSALMRGDFLTIPTTILYPEKGLWFLWALFFITLINTISCRFAYRIRLSDELINIFIAIILLISMRAFNYFCYPTIAKFYLFYIAGFYLRKYSNCFDRWDKYIIIPSFLLFLTMFILFHQNKSSFYINWGVINDLVCKIFLPMIAIIGFISLFKTQFCNRLIISKLGG